MKFFWSWQSDTPAIPGAISCGTRCSPPSSNCASPRTWRRQPPGVHVSTVDQIGGNRIKFTKKDSGEGSDKGHHHYIDRGLVAGVEGDKVRLSATGAVAVEKN
jgi:hypothetical protein